MLTSSCDRREAVRIAVYSLNTMILFSAFTVLTHFLLCKISVPANIQFLTPNLTVNERVAIDLRCEVSGYPAPNILWKKDEKQTKPTGEELHVNSSKRSDTGAYVCKADNNVRQAVYMKTYVVVHCKYEGRL